jgi:hypothetical protein
MLPARNEIAVWQCKEMNAGLGLKCERSVSEAGVGLDVVYGCV